MDGDDFDLGLQLLGIVTQFISVCLSSCNRVAIKWTEREGIGPGMLGAFQFGVGFAALFLYEFIRISMDFSEARMLYMKPSDAGMVVFFGFGVYFFATWLQIRIVRTLGPTLHTSFQPARLISSLAG